MFFSLIYVINSTPIRDNPTCGKNICVWRVHMNQIIH